MPLKTSPIAQTDTSPSIARPSLVDAVLMAIEKYTNIKKQYLRNAVISYVSQFGYTNVDAVNKVFDNRAWHRLRKSFWDMNATELASKITAMDVALTRNEGKPREGYHRVRLEIAQQVFEKRGFTMPEPKTERLRINKKNNAQQAATAAQGEVLLLDTITSDIPDVAQNDTYGAAYAAQGRDMLAIEKAKKWIESSHVNLRPHQFAADLNWWFYRMPEDDEGFTHEDAFHAAQQMKEETTKKDDLKAAPVMLELPQCTQLLAMAA